MWRVRNQIINKNRFEVFWLINHVRPVKVLWHRNNGQVFITHFIKSFQEKKYVVPKEIKGITLSCLLENMTNVLRDYGSPALKKDIEKYRADIIEKIKYLNKQAFEPLIDN